MIRDTEFKEKKKERSYGKRLIGKLGKEVKGKEG